MCACVDVLNFPLPFLFSSFLRCFVCACLCLAVSVSVHCCIAAVVCRGCVLLLCVGTLFVFMTNSGGAYLSGPYDVNYGYGGEQ